MNGQLVIYISRESNVWYQNQKSVGYQELLLELVLPVLMNKEQKINRLTFNSRRRNLISDRYRPWSETRFVKRERRLAKKYSSRREKRREGKGLASRKCRDAMPCQRHPLSEESPKSESTDLDCCCVCEPASCGCVGNRGIWGFCDRKQIATRAILISEGEDRPAGQVKQHAGR